MESTETSVVVEFPLTYSASLIKRVVEEVCEALESDFVFNVITDENGEGWEIGRSSQSAFRHVRVTPSRTEHLFRPGRGYSSVVVSRHRWDVPVSPVGYHTYHVVAALGSFAEKLTERTR